MSNLVPMNGDFLVVPVDGPFGLANVSPLGRTGNPSGMRCRKFHVYQAIVVSAGAINVTTNDAGQKAGVGIYDLAGNLVVVFNGFDLGTTGTKTVVLAKPFLLKPGIYLAAFGSTGATGLSSLVGINNTDSLQGTSRLCFSAANPVDTLGNCPQTLGNLTNSTSISPAIVLT
jgi:hypothetical protein